MPPLRQVVLTQWLALWRARPWQQPSQGWALQSGHVRYAECRMPGAGAHAWPLLVLTGASVGVCCLHAHSLTWSY